MNHISVCTHFPYTTPMYRYAHIEKYFTKYISDPTEMDPHMYVIILKQTCVHIFKLLSQTFITTTTHTVHTSP